MNRLVTSLKYFSMTYSGHIVIFYETIVTGFRLAGSCRVDTCRSARSGRCAFTPYLHHGPRQNYIAAVDVLVRGDVHEPGYGADAAAEGSRALHAR
jgi:hypothetical protein